MMTNEFRSRFNYKLYWLAIFFLPFLALSFWGMSAFYDDLFSGRPIENIGFNLVFPLAFYAFLAYSIYFYIRSSPKIIVNAHTLTIGNKTIPVAEIASIHIHSASNRFFLFMPYSYAEVSSLKLKDGTIHHLFVEHYINGSALRTSLETLENFLNGIIPVFDLAAIAKKEFYPNYRLDTFITFRQTPFRSFNFYIYTPIILGIFWMTANTLDRPWGVTAFLLILGIFFYFLLVWQNHYFQLSANYLLVKNFYFPWRVKAFHLARISSVTTQTLPKQETALKVITTDYKIHRYQSALMSDKMYQNLIGEIKRNRNALKKKQTIPL